MGLTLGYIHIKLPTMSEQLVKDALVRWNEDREVYGFIKEIADNRIHVEWDMGDAPEKDRPVLFAKSNPPLERVVLKSGDEVLRHSTNEQGYVLNQVDGASRPTWEVLFSESGKVSLAERDLRPRDSDDPVARLKKGEHLGTAQEINLALCARHYKLEHFNNPLVSLAAAKVDLKLHQVSVAHRVTQNHPHRFLLCDEVGLGKTIEAGAILKELRARGSANRVLTIVPANLQKQWQFELNSKFNEKFAIFNSNFVKQLKDQGHPGNPFNYPHSPHIIVSHRWITNEPQSTYVKEIDWDLVIVDEAHHVRSHRKGDKIETTQLYRVVSELTAHPKMAVLLLTATPMQLSPHELYALIEILDPALFPSERNFDEHRREVPRLGEIVERLGTYETLSEKEKSDLANRAALFMGTDPREIEQRFSKGRDAIEKIREELSRKHLLSNVLIRNRKSVVGGFMPRQAHRWEVLLTDEERCALNKMEDYVQDGYALADQIADSQKRTAINFVMVIYQKLMASSIHALRCSLERRLKKLADDKPHRSEYAEYSSDGDYVLPESAELVSAIMEHESEKLSDLIQDLNTVSTDSKAEKFISRMNALRSEEPKAKILVFTQFRDTQDYLAENLRTHNWGVSVFHGAMTPAEKDRAVEQFREATTPHILVSTEAGGEGRNFQFCHLLVNYDLPWNPMRVEQRIGRVDRIGQEQPVQIFNLWVRGTIEEKILHVLDSRIKLFETAIGGLDPILGKSTEKDIKNILRMGRDGRERALREFEQRKEHDIAKAREAEEKLRDFIMDTKSFSKEIAEKIKGRKTPIGPEAQESFMVHLMKGIGVRLKKEATKMGQWSLSLGNSVLQKRRNLFTDLNRTAVFRPDVPSDAEEVQYFALGHPVVDAALSEVMSDKWKGNAGIISHAQESIPHSGWLFVWNVDIPDMREHKELLPVFVGDGDVVDLDTGWKLVELATQFSNSHVANQNDFSIDALDNAHALAKKAMEKVAHKKEQEAQQSLKDRIVDERRKQTGFFDYRDRVAANKCETIRATVEKLSRDDDKGRQNILPAWKAQLRNAEALMGDLKKQRQEKMSDLDGRLHQTASWQLVGAYRVAVTL